MLFAELFPGLPQPRSVLPSLDVWGAKGASGGKEVHCDVYVFHSHLAMDFLHGFAGILHSDEGFLVDVCGFDGIDLLLEHGYLPVRLLEGVFVLLLSLKGIPRNYQTPLSASIPTIHPTAASRPLIFPS